MGELMYSKLGATYDKQKIMRKEKAYLKEVNAIKKAEGNDCCAECGDAASNWASVTLGVFVCTPCSQIHRGLGAHVSKVKSCMGTYVWCPDEIDAMRRMGNARARQVYCAGPGAPRPQPRRMDELIEIAKDKYDRKKWFRPGGWDSLFEEISQQPPAAAPRAAAVPQTPAPVTSLPAKAPEPPSAFAFLNAKTAPAAMAPPPAAVTRPPPTPNLLDFGNDAAPKSSPARPAGPVAAAWPDVLDVLFGTAAAQPPAPPQPPAASHAQRVEDLLGLFSQPS